MSDDTKQELADYQKELYAAKQKLIDQRNPHDGARPHTSQDEVLIIAIDGLLMRLDNTNPSEITLTVLVELVDNIQEVLKSTEHFLQHKPQSIRAQ
jgi:hypothetical protein